VARRPQRRRTGLLTEWDFLLRGLWIGNHIHYLATEYIAPKWNTVPLSEPGRRISARGKMQTVREGPQPTPSLSLSFKGTPTLPLYLQIVVVNFVKTL
jgi:hypothetical protein